MSFMVAPYLFAVGGGGGDTNLLGALAYIGSDYATSASATATIAYDSESYDAASYHDNSTNNDRLTIPSGVTRGRYIGNSGGSSSQLATIQQLKNGASFAGHVYGYSDASSADDISNFASAIVSVSGGDYFTTQVQTTGTATTLRATSNWASFEPIASGIKGALVQKTGAQTVASSTTVTLTWAAEVYDTDAFHDNSTNNSRLTVPSGVSLVRVSASLATTTNLGAGDQIVITMLKNGSAVVGCFAKDTLSASRPGRLCAVSGILAVSPGDYFEVQVFQSGGARDYTAQDDTWFQIEEVPSARKYALVNKSATQAITGNTWTAVAFGAEVADTDGIHDNSTNNTRMTVPSGCTRARAMFNIKTPSSGALMQGRVIKNGSHVAGLPWFVTDTTGTDSLNGFGAWIDVSPGDYLECQFQASLGLTLGTDAETWFCVEFA